MTRSLVMVSRAHRTQTATTNLESFSSARVESRVFPFQKDPEVHGNGQTDTT